MEMQGRGVSQAKAVTAMTDGAPWIEGFIDLPRSDAVRAVDGTHTAEHLALPVEALAQANIPLPEQALERSLHVLKYRQPG